MATGGIAFERLTWLPEVTKQLSNSRQGISQRIEYVESDRRLSLYVVALLWIITVTFAAYLIASPNVSRFYFSHGVTLATMSTLLFGLLARSVLKGSSEQISALSQKRESASQAMRSVKEISDDVTGVDSESVKKGLLELEKSDFNTLIQQTNDLYATSTFPSEDFLKAVALCAQEIRKVAALHPLFRLDLLLRIDVEGHEKILVNLCKHPIDVIPQQDAKSLLERLPSDISPTFLATLFPTNLKGWERLCVRHPLSLLVKINQDSSCSGANLVMKGLKAQKTSFASIDQALFNALAAFLDKRYFSNANKKQTLDAQQTAVFTRLAICSEKLLILPMDGLSMLFRERLMRLTKDELCIEALFPQNVKDLTSELLSNLIATYPTIFDRMVVKYESYQTPAILNRIATINMERAQAILSKARFFQGFVLNMKKRDLPAHELMKALVFCSEQLLAIESFDRLSREVHLALLTAISSKESGDEKLLRRLILIYAETLTKNRERDQSFIVPFQAQVLKYLPVLGALLSEAKDKPLIPLLRRYLKLYFGELPPLGFMDFLRALLPNSFPQNNEKEIFGTILRTVVDLRYRLSKEAIKFIKEHPRLNVEALDSKFLGEFLESVYKSHQEPPKEVLQICEWAPDQYTTAIQKFLGDASDLHDRVPREAFFTRLRLTGF